MFPTIGHLLSDQTGLSLYLPLPTFGFVMTLSFVAAFWIFRSEYKRKEAGGLIHPFTEPYTEMASTTGGRLLILSGWGILGFVIGAKTMYAWVNRSFYIGALPDFLFSLRGSWPGGIAVGFLALLAAWGFQRRRPASKTMETSHTVHPYQLMDRILLYCGISGFAGAILFARLEGQAGLNYYGALIAGALTYLYINRRHGIPPAIAADIGSPGMMLAYGLGRIGCHLAGDGDWGIVNNRPQPSWLHWTPAWTWSFRFPHNAIHHGEYIPGCADNYCNILPNPVYPTSFYEAVICLLLFTALWTLRTRIRRTGLLFAIFALLNGVERFTIEYIRITPRYPIGSWNLSQAQIIAAGWIIAGLLALTFSLKKRAA